MYSNIPINNINYSLQVHETTPAAIRQFLQCFEQTLRTESVEFKNILLDEFYKLLYIINENNKDQSNVKSIFNNFENLLKYEDTLTQQLLTEDNLTKFKQEILKSNIFVLLKQYLHTTTKTKVNINQTASKQVLQTIKNIKFINVINTTLFKNLTTTTNSNIKKSNEYTNELDTISEDIENYKSQNSKGLFSTVLNSAFKIPGIMFSAAASLGTALLKGTSFALKYTIKTISIPIKLAAKTILFGASVVGKLIKFLLFTPTGLKITALVTGFLYTYFKNFSLLDFFKKTLAKFVTPIITKAKELKNTTISLVTNFYSEKIEPIINAKIQPLFLNLKQFFSDNSINSIGDCSNLIETIKTNFAPDKLSNNAQSVLSVVNTVKASVAKTLEVVDWIKTAFKTISSKEFLHIIVSSLIGGALGMVLPVPFNLMALAGTALWNRYKVANKIQDIARDEKIYKSKMQMFQNMQNAKVSEVAQGLTDGTTIGEQAWYIRAFADSSKYDVKKGNHLIKNSPLLYQGTEWKIIDYNDNTLVLSEGKYAIADYESFLKKTTTHIVATHQPTDMNKVNQSEAMAVAFYQVYNGHYQDKQHIVEQFINMYVKKRNDAIKENAENAKYYPTVFPILIVSYKVDERSKLKGNMHAIVSRTKSTTALIGNYADARSINGRVTTGLLSSDDAVKIGFSGKSVNEIVSFGISRIAHDPTTQIKLKITKREEHNIEFTLFRIFDIAFTTLYRTYYGRRHAGTNIINMREDGVNVYTKLTDILSVYINIMNIMLNTDISQALASNIIDAQEAKVISEKINNALDDIQSSYISKLNANGTTATAQPERYDNNTGEKQRITNIENITFVRNCVKTFTTLVVYFSELTGIKFTHSNISDKILEIINTKREELNKIKHTDSEYILATKSKINAGANTLYGFIYGAIDNVVYRIMCESRETVFARKKNALEVAPSTLIPYIFYKKYQSTRISDCITHYDASTINDAISITFDILEKIMNKVSTSAGDEHIYNVYLNDFMLGNEIVMKLTDRSRYSKSGISLLKDNSIKIEIRKALHHFVSSPLYAFAAINLVFNMLNCLRTPSTAAIVCLIGKMKTTAISNETHLKELSKHIIAKIKAKAPGYNNPDLMQFTTTAGIYDAEAVASFFKYFLLSGYTQNFDASYIADFKGALANYTNEIANELNKESNQNKVLTTNVLRNTFMLELSDGLNTELGNSDFYVNTTDRQISFNDLTFKNLNNDDKLQLFNFYGIANTKDGYSQLAKSIKLSDVSLNSLTKHANLLMPYLYIYNILAKLKSINSLKLAQDMLSKTGLSSVLANLFRSALLVNTFKGKNINIPVEIFTNANLQLKLAQLLYALTNQRLIPDGNNIVDFDEKYFASNLDDNKYNELVSDAITHINDSFSKAGNRQTIIDNYSLESVNGQKTNIINAQLKTTWGNVISEIFNKLPNTINDQVLLDMFTADHSDRLDAFTNDISELDTIAASFDVVSEHTKKDKRTKSAEIIECIDNNNIVLYTVFSPYKTFYSLQEANEYLYSYNHRYLHELLLKAYNKSENKHIGNIKLTKLAKGNETAEISTDASEEIVKLDTSF